MELKATGTGISCCIEYVYIDRPKTVFTDALRPEIPVYSHSSVMPWVLLCLSGLL